MLCLRRCLVCCVLLTSGARAANTLENAGRAAAMLGRETWSRVIRVENTAERSAYPATFHALVFEFGGLLWFYADGSGTQSFSLHTNNLAVEQADFAPLLRAIDPGFTRFAFVAPGATAPPQHFRGDLSNGCFIDSVAALRERVARGDLIGRARLLSFYGASPAGRIRHTLLTYETSAGAFVLDRQVSGTPRRIGSQLPDEPRAVVEAVSPEVVVDSARWVPTTLPRNPSLLAAAATVGRSAVARR